MFLDEKVLTVEAGRGGDGAALFRREIYVPHGGPDGGDGGRGGDVILEARANVHTLSHLAHISKFKADDGKTGGHKRSTGKSGEDIIIPICTGTEIYVVGETGWEKIADLLTEGERLVIAKGGNGGWGNWHFRSSVNQAPERFNLGQEGEKKVIRLVVKLIADVGLVGLPNSGKSTLLSVISNAHPKIANYPFTTLEPQLGVASIGGEEEGRHLVVADLPGLIEGASDGKGLGDTFLRHLERTEVIIHCVDISQTIAEMEANYRVIRAELTAWSPLLAAKPEVIALTKADTLLPEEAETKEKEFTLWLKNGKYKTAAIKRISSVAHQGLDVLLTSVSNLVK
jgi:GTP-binding protein